MGRAGKLGGFFQKYRHRGRGMLHNAAFMVLDPERLIFGI
jgi:hypothetical protein